MPLISLTDVTKAYAGTPALRAVNLSIEPGEIHALMGENGAGKSTLIKILAGVVAPDSARIEIDGSLETIDSPKTAHRLGLRFIHQEFNVVPALSVAENIFLGRRYPMRGGVFIDWTALNAAARRTLEKLGISHIDPRKKLGDLSLGDQMLVRISSAFLGETGAPARLYVLDEPTAALTRDESARLFTVLRELAATGCAVLYVSHRLDEVMSLCNRATVIRDGRTIDTGKIANITHDDLVALMIGRTVTEAYPPRSAAIGTEPVLVLDNARAAGLRPVSFSVRRGEIFGIAGLSNSGQRELLQLLIGDRVQTSGTMTLAGTPHRPTGVAAAWRSGLAYVPRERRSEGLVLSRPISENITLPHLSTQSRWGLMQDRRRERKFSTALGAQVRLKSTGPLQRAFELSGGNQQKIVFAKAIGGSPKVLLLDEPTRGVDIGARFDLYTLIRDKAAGGMAVIIVSSDLSELLGLCDRMAIMADGAISQIVDATDLSEDALINLCYGRQASAQPDPIAAGDLT